MNEYSEATQYQRASGVYFFLGWLAGMATMLLAVLVLAVIAQDAYSAPLRVASYTKQSSSGAPLINADNTLNVGNIEHLSRFDDATLYLLHTSIPLCN